MADLVDRAYEVFAVPPPPAHLGVCDCCVGADAMARLRRGPQRAIELDDLREWYFGAFHPERGRATARWLLPRILECFAAGQWVCSIENSIALRRLQETGFPDTSDPSEHEFLRNFMIRLAHAFIASPDTYRDAIFDLDELLRTAALGGIDLAPVLARLNAVPTPQLIAVMAWNDQPTFFGEDPFWEPGLARDQAITWWASEAMEDRMITYALDGTNPETLRNRAGWIADAIARRRSMI
ncbi:MAG: hypothetical protein AAFV19_13555 [Pseudomonadota bacterium]